MPVPHKGDQEVAVATLDEAHEVNGLLTSSLDSADPSSLRQAVLRKAFAGDL